MPRLPRPSRVAHDIQDVFKDKIITHCGEVASLTGIKYYTMSRLFYALREIGLIEYVREEDTPRLIELRERGIVPSEKYQELLKYRLHRIVPGKEDDERWDSYPISELYPASRLGGARYREGTAEGRRDEYLKKEEE